MEHNMESVRLSMLLTKFEFFLSGEVLKCAQRNLLILIYKSLKHYLKVQQAIRKANCMLALIAKGFQS